MQYKKKGRRLGSKKEVAPDILKRFREALFLHAHGRDIEVIQAKWLFSVGMMLIERKLRLRNALHNLTEKIN